MEIGGHSELNNTKILIIGGGPAGTAAAILAARFGLSVTLIESTKFPRYRPGETLHPGVEPLLDRLGVKQDILAAKFIRHTGIWISRNSGSDDDKNSNKRKLIAFGGDEKGPWLGYQAWGATLDNVLLRQAGRCGVTILQPCQVLDVILQDGRKVVGLKTSCGNLMADFVIDAGGGKHWLARRLKLLIEKHSAPLFAYFGYAQGQCPSRDENPAITVTPEGWLWTAKIRKDVYQWTRLYFNHNINYNNKNNKNVTFPHYWLPDEFKGLTPIRSMHGADVTWRIVDVPAGLGYFIVGDAAAVVDPSSSHGVLRALMSGMMASHTIFRIVHDRIPSTYAISGYNYWISKWFFYDIEKLKKLYSFHSTYKIQID
jgi:flavin-dependent dehydrogenase